MLASVRAMRSGRAVPLSSVFLVATSTLSGRSARKPPSASACDGVSVFDQRAEPIDAGDRDALGRAAAITQAELSCHQRAVGGERDLLGERPAVLGEDGEFNRLAHAAPRASAS